MTRSLLLKGLAGVAALGGVGVGGWFALNSGLLGGNKDKKPEEPKSKDVSKFTQKELIDKVGLDCKLEGDDIGGETKDCTVKEGGTKIKIGDKEEEGVTFTVNGSKLKVSKSEETGADGTDRYTKKLKFVVDSGDISLTKGGSEATTISKLEQFETYEVFLKEGGKFYLRRKTEAKEEKIKALGLPSGCTLPETGTSECSLSKEVDIKAVKFEKQESEQISVSSEAVKLKISKVEGNDFTDGYRFTFTFPSDVTINSKQLKANTPYDFKIKKGTGNALTLERAWTEDSVFTKKAGLDCSGGNKECNVSTTDPKLNVKVGTQKKEGITAKTGGKIKMETDQPGYNQGLKFTISGGDVTLTNGTSPAGSGNIEKLEQFETYEITEEGGKYYLTRKDEASKTIETQLGLPSSCKLSSTSSCALTEETFKNINFKDKSSPSATGEITLKVSKVNSTDFPLGYKFTFNTAADATITTTTNIIKKNVPTDFKIKVEDGKAVSLEKAWSDTNYSFAGKVGLNCTDSDGCSTKSSSQEKLNVKRGSEVKTGIESVVTTATSKIKVEKDQAGYNQGLKFTISGGDVTLTGGSGNIQKLEELETYEITEENDKYYLARKNEAIKTIGDLLGLPSTCKLSSPSSPCSLSTEQIKKINFHDKDTNGATATANATLTIASGADSNDFPLGYKFTLQSGQDITIKNGTPSPTNKVAANTNTEFKIKKGDTGGQTTLTLEKAWTADSLGKKVGLSCTNGSDCTISGSSLKVKQDNFRKDTGLSKGNSSGSGSAKIKVTKDQAGYNQGFKFEIEGGFISLSGGTKNETTDKITRLGEYETYEIKEDGEEWYLVRKNKADDVILKGLGLKGLSDCSSLGLPDDSRGDTCTIEKLEDLKKIKFDNKGHTWPSGTIKIQLEIKQEASLPSGFKFTFSDARESDSEDLCIPDGKGNAGKVNLKSNSNSGVDYKIKKDGESFCLESSTSSGGGQCAS